MQVKASCRDSDWIDRELIVGDGEACDDAVVGGYLRSEASGVNKGRVEDSELNGEGCGLQ